MYFKIFFDNRFLSECHLNYNYSNFKFKYHLINLISKDIISVYNDEYIILIISILKNTCKIKYERKEYRFIRNKFDSIPHLLAIAYNIIYPIHICM